MHTHRLGWLGGLLLAAGHWMPAAQADDVQPGTELSAVPVAEPAEAATKEATAPIRRGNALVEEVVVTAQKREENLQDVPLSVQAFNSRQLDALGVSNAVDLPRITPGFVLTESIGFVSTFIRGLGTDAFVFADPSVAFYVDGIYNPSPTTAT